MRITPFAAIVLLVLSSYSTAQTKRPTQKLVTEHEAEKLITIAVKTTGSGRVPKFGLDRATSDPPGYIVYQALWDNFAGGSAVLGTYAVDMRTGDVWDAIICKEYNSPQLMKAQRAIRKRLGITEAEYRKLRKPGPMCD